MLQMGTMPITRTVGSQTRITLPALAGDITSTLAEENTRADDSSMVATRLGSSIRGRPLGATRMMFTSYTPMEAITCTTVLIPACASRSTFFSVFYAAGLGRFCQVPIFVKAKNGLSDKPPLKFIST